MIMLPDNFKHFLSILSKSYKYFVYELICKWNVLIRAFEQL